MNTLILFHSIRGLHIHSHARTEAFTHTLTHPHSDKTLIRRRSLRGSLSANIKSQPRNALLFISGTEHLENQLKQSNSSKLVIEFSRGRVP